MISDRIIHLQAFRMYIINFCFCSPVSWNLTQKRMQASKSWHFWNWWLVIGGASAYTLTVFGRIYHNSVSVFSKGNENEREYILSKSGKMILVSLIYLTMDTLACGFIFLTISFAIMLSGLRPYLWRVNNAILEINRRMLKKLELHNGFRPSGQDASGRKTEFILHMLNVGSLALPIMYGFSILHPYEPVHRSVKEWFEITPKPSLGFLPMMLMLDWGLVFCGNVVYIPISLVVIYMELCQFWIPGITPRSIVLFQGKRRYSTALGLIDDRMIIKLYRYQQIMNVLVNDLIRSCLVSLHHALILMIFVLSAFMCIHYMEDVRAMGIAGWILPAAGFSALLIEYHETHLLGKILWESREFIKVGQTVTRPGTELKRFFRSCTDIKIRSAHPYFVVSYDTFLLILHHGFDFLVSMLVFA